MLKQINIGGELRPIHFGIWALSQISEALNIDQSKILEGMFVTKLADQITIIRIGLIEGAKKIARHYGVKLSPEIQHLDNETVADWLDADPEALDGATSLYFEQCFGKKLEVLISEYEKQVTNLPDQVPGTPTEENPEPGMVPNTGKKVLAASAETLKNALERVKNVTSQLPSLDLPKSAPAGLA